ncbi:copper amine oxidase N-terminal domain-containing protein [Acetivibrio mesophilus]|uniref:Copper amine oxidase N-terminal domain-containing protein n=1 Tax=Acetivibrio mesophilus TaxID=2487273 RepID=A0A4Q0I1Y5_9FIRM|nr:copper amine oxidase N-terminal domain-containing protein [Acetivibrio mesophilus]ODM26601.1 copper amine oxidase [Clostridium sp. Bc-iso-3]RXE57687.1 copper amine oxidase N-terminal domain-containing protein [Acetivibrio mesophilus]
MKRIAKILTVILVITYLFSVPTFAVDLPIRVVVNGTKINFPDVEPFIDENSRTQVPIRFVGEALGADVSWDGNTKKVTITLNGRKVVLQIGNKNYEVNGQKKQMDTVALLKESRTFVPVRFVSEALGATVKWNANIKTVYIDMNGDVIPSPDPTEGSVKYYDGIAFNDTTDVDAYGRIKIEKSKEFLLKLADQLRFVKENGKYYIECTYPEIPEGYEWGLGIAIFNKDGTYTTYSPVERNPKWLIPAEGSFKKEATDITNINNVDLFSILVSLDHPETESLGILNIAYYLDRSKMKIKFVPESGALSPEDYTATFDFNKMFQW